MSIANKPDVLIADEPTTALDVTVQSQIIDLLKDLQKKLGMTLIFISHDLSLVKKISDYVFVMKNGKIIENETNRKIFNDPQHDYTKELISIQDSKKLNKFYEKNEILKIENLKVWYPIKKGLLRTTTDYVKAVNNLNLVLYKGESIGIVGESGSGKSSVILAILKLIESTGKIMINKRN